MSQDMNGAFSPLLCCSHPMARTVKRLFLVSHNFCAQYMDFTPLRFYNLHNYSLHVCILTSQIIWAVHSVPSCSTEFYDCRYTHIHKQYSHLTVLCPASIVFCLCAKCVYRLQSIAYGFWVQKISFDRPKFVWVTFTIYVPRNSNAIRTHIIIIISK